eukprot:gene11511-46934_t
MPGAGQMYVVVPKMAPAGKAAKFLGTSDVGTPAECMKKCDGNAACKAAAKAAKGDELVKASGGCLKLGENPPIIEDHHDDQPYSVRGPRGDEFWYRENE